MDFSKIKLIIWDLDETLWPGVLSEGTAKLGSENSRLIQDTTDAGVIHSICSKNDPAAVEAYLREYSLWDLFVFNSINWSAKGERVLQIITEMNLRDANVLFIDDNPLNLQEAKDSCPNLMIASPEVIPDLRRYFENLPKKDPGHERLLQYKTLEKKRQFKASIGSNEEFLRNCNIQVSVKEDCTAHLDRILDLIQRSNQLNFTKIRSRKEELADLFSDSSVRCGYVEVHDRFGDYGIVGFFALKGQRLLHFAFSCRTLNMGVEQYVYHLLGRPELTVTGEVSSSLDGPMPDWINRGPAVSPADSKKQLRKKVLMKGPCDMSLIFSFINDGKNVIQEFVYVNEKGVSIEGGNHTSHIVQSLTLPQETKARLSETLPFGDKDMYRTDFFRKDLSAVFFSLFTDANLGLYREKSSGAVVAFGEWVNDLTDESLWDSFIHKELFVAECTFSRESLKYIKDNFDFLGRLQPKEILQNLDILYSNLGSGTKLILNLGSEIPYEKNVQPAYADRHLYHSELNHLVRQWKEDKPNVYLIEATRFISSQSDYTNNINHFVKSVYYQMAQELVSILDHKHIKVRTRQKQDFILRLKEKLCALLARFH